MRENKRRHNGRRQVPNSNRQSKVVIDHPKTKKGSEKFYSTCFVDCRQTTSCAACDSLVASGNAQSSANRHNRRCGDSAPRILKRMRCMCRRCARSNRCSLSRTALAKNDTEPPTRRSIDACITIRTLRCGLCSDASATVGWRTTTQALATCIATGFRNTRAHNAWPIRSTK